MKTRTRQPDKAAAAPARPAAQERPGFVPPMHCLAVHELPEGPEWSYEVKWDGYRAQVVKDAKGKVVIYSRNEKRLDTRFTDLAAAFAAIPGSFVIDGEIVAFDPSGRPSFQLLQNSRKLSHGAAFYAFDLLHLNGVDLRGRVIEDRRKQLVKVLEKPLQRLFAGKWTAVRISPVLNATGAEVFAAVKRLGMEGVVGKRLGSLYETGDRSGAWVKMRANREQEFVIGGYTPGTRGFDAIVIGYYEQGRLIYAARVKNGFRPILRDELFPELKKRAQKVCPFANLPEPKGGRWGEPLTAEKMEECRWVKPELVCQVAFVEWTEASHLRHATFIGMREDKRPRDVVRET